MTCGFGCGSFLLAGPGPPVMNGIFKVCHWTRASFLTKYCRRPLRFLSGFFFCPRAAGSESLKLNFKMSVCSRSVFDEETSGKWHLLELPVPYLRLFSFCDYTIPYPRRFVYSQTLQSCNAIFVHIQGWITHAACGIINMLGACTPE